MTDVALQADRLSLAHVVKIMDASPDSEWGIAQPITLESMRVARRFSQHRVAVSFYAAGFPEELTAVPPDISPLRALDRSVLDLQPFQIPRRLPLYRDILDRLYAASDAEFFIYTNIDIGVMPHFYQRVCECIEQGLDAFTINRRNIGEHYTSVAELPVMYAEAGEKHPGFDCFVFRRERYPRFVVGDGCLGMGNGETGLLCSLIATAGKFHDFNDEHLTFHIGKGASWRTRVYGDYRSFCDRASVAAIRSLLLRSDRRPGPALALTLATGIVRHRLLVPALKRLFNAAWNDSPGIDGRVRTEAEMAVTGNGQLPGVCTPEPLSAETQGRP